MRAGIWFTGHEIADRITEAVITGLSDAVKFSVFNAHASHDALLRDVRAADIHIGYGILRGMDRVYRAAAQTQRPWFCIDRGYWQPGHYAGYYRISLNGTQQTTGLVQLEPDYARLDRLGLTLEPYRGGSVGSKVLICPPTAPVCAFFGVDEYRWAAQHAGTSGTYVFRTKDATAPINYADYGAVITFNSGVGWEALRLGLPVVSDKNHSLLGAYQKQVDEMPQLDLDSRRRFFAIQAGLQLSLAEIRAGKIWPLITRLLSTSAGMDAKPLPAMLPPIVSAAAQKPT